MTGHALPQSGISSSGSIFYPVNASTFPGSAFIINSSVTLTKYSKGTCSFWYITSGAGNAAQLINLYNSGNSSPGVFLALNSANTIQCSLGAASNTIYYTFTSNISLSPYENNKWHNFIVSWDYTIPKFQLYIDGQPITLTQTSHSTTSTADANTIFVEPRVSGSNISSISEYWLLTNVSLDISSLSNIRRFFSATNRPQFLGSNGSIPTNTQAEIYLKGSGTGFNVNSGSAGNLTTTGTLTTPTTTPASP